MYIECNVLFFCHVLSHVLLASARVDLIAFNFKLSYSVQNILSCILLSTTPTPLSRVFSLAAYYWSLLVYDLTAKYHLLQIISKYALLRKHYGEDVWRSYYHTGLLQTVITDIALYITTSATLSRKNESRERSLTVFCQLSRPILRPTGIYFPASLCCRVGALRRTSLPPEFIANKVQALKIISPAGHFHSTCCLERSLSFQTIYTRQNTNQVARRYTLKISACGVVYQESKNVSFIYHGTQLYSLNDICLGTTRAVVAIESLWTLESLTRDFGSVSYCTLSFNSAMFSAWDGSKSRKQLCIWLSCTQYSWEISACRTFD